jgi:hypothetical protein
MVLKPLLTQVGFPRVLNIASDLPTALVLSTTNFSLLIFTLQGVVNEDKIMP